MNDRPRNFSLIVLTLALSQSLTDYLDKHQLNVPGCIQCIVQCILYIELTVIYSKIMLR